MNSRVTSNGWRHFRTRDAPVARSALLTLILSSIAVVAYLGYRALDLVPVSSVSDPEPVTVVDTEPVETLPDFSLTDVDGELQSIRNWSDRAMIVNFWATWCAPCLREIPLLVDYQSRYQDALSLQVIGIAVDQIDPVKAFMENMPFNYPVLVGQAEAMDAAAAFGVDFYGLPFSVFTAPDGHVLGIHTGELHAEDLDNVVATLEALSDQRIDIAGARARLAGRR